MTVWHYYNEIDPGAAQWLRNLIARKLIPAGIVDERSIKEVQPDDLAGFTQCHFFAGIGGWPFALQLAGWPATRPVWTGSCPCQPFSTAGKRNGANDERHLWPVLLQLIDQCRPAIVFGEQVASAAGRVWLSGVRADLEKLAYAVGAADLCVASVGAPHIRQRLFWVGNTSRDGLRNGGWSESGMPDESSDGSIRRMAHRDSNRCDQAGGREPSKELHGAGGNGAACGLSDADCNTVRATEIGELGSGHAAESDRHCAWNDAVWIQCADGKARRIEPGISPLAHGVPARVVKLRGYGNAINPQVAAEFISAALECIDGEAAA